MAVGYGQTRFIPAGAGNTSKSAVQSRRCPVYPRWRGEHPCSVELKPGLIGLSPLARGTRRRRKFLLPEARFIPAGAGNTVPFDSSIVSTPVYPRWRGEHRIRGYGQGTGCGLSPLARGTLSERMPERGDYRFIPAGAGNTKCISLQLFRKTVYPRWRGEHALIMSWSISAGGLSPLARGTQK